MILWYYSKNIKACKIIDFAGFCMLLKYFQRRERDSNPRYLAVQRFSRPPQSTTLPSLLMLFCSKAVQRYAIFRDYQILKKIFYVKILIFKFHYLFLQTHLTHTTKCISIISLYFNTITAF